jgi:DNA repair exonuclease SbcCD nuclease subunit
MEVPVFIAPGNHDYYGEKSPWFRELWPDNVHIFTKQEISSVPIPQLDCRVYGGAFTQMDCPGLLDGFRAECDERYAVMVLHGDPSAADSPYCPVTAAQARDSGLDYLALGHIHTPGRFGAGAGMCAWPGCPMGRGYDETGIKGVLIVELEERPVIRFQSLDTPRFYDLAVEAGTDPAGALEKVLPAERNEDFYRVRLTGESAAVELARLSRRFSRLPNLKLLDETANPDGVWQTGGADSLEGLYFEILRQRLATARGDSRQALELAAKVSRQILRGQEVELP